MADIRGYALKPINSETLKAEIVAAGLPAPTVAPYVADETIWVPFAAPITSAQATTLDGVVAAHVPPKPKMTPEKALAIRLSDDWPTLTAEQRREVQDTLNDVARKVN